MIIYIDKEGRENIIRSDELIEKLINENIIVENTLLKTEISGDWIVAKDFDLFKNIKKISEPIIKPEDIKKDLLKEYELIIKNPNKISDFQKKWDLHALQLNGDELIKSSKEFSKANIWLAYNKKIQHLLIGRNIITNFAAFIADNNRGLNENFSKIFNIKEADKLEIIEQPIIEIVGNNYQIKNKGILNIPKLKSDKNLSNEEKKQNENNIKSNKIPEKENNVKEDNQKIIDEKFYIPKGSSVPKVDNTNTNNQINNDNKKENTITEKPKETPINTLNKETSKKEVSHKKIGFMKAIKVCLSKYFDFKGRARRSEYWYFLLFVMLVSFTLAFAEGFYAGYTGQLDFEESIFANIFYLFVVIPSIAVSVRRLHDIGRTGWWVLISFIPIVGTLVLLIWHCADGEKDTNIYGVSPKY